MLVYYQASQYHTRVEDHGDILVVAALADTSYTTRTAVHHSAATVDAKGKLTTFLSKVAKNVQRLDHPFLPPQANSGQFRTSRAASWRRPAQASPPPLTH
jgi:hypothetical protein